MVVCDSDLEVPEPQLVVCYVGCDVDGVTVLLDDDLVCAAFGIGVYGDGVCAGLAENGFERAADVEFCEVGNFVLAGDCA